MPQTWYNTTTLPSCFKLWTKHPGFGWRPYSGAVLSLRQPDTGIIERRCLNNSKRFSCYEVHICKWCINFTSTSLPIIKSHEVIIYGTKKVWKSKIWKLQRGNQQNMVRMVTRLLWGSSCYTYAYTLNPYSVHLKPLYHYLSIISH